MRRWRRTGSWRASRAGSSSPRRPALPLAGVTALVSVDAVDPHEGDTVLVVGADGGVGSYALQLAAKRGATVIATAKPDDEQRLRPEEHTSELQSPYDLV